jgi:uncharacterized glyoxalase superfamily protein PhnB
MTPSPNAVPPIPEGASTVMPWIISRDTARLLDFMKQALGAQELSRMYNKDGTIGHAEAKIGDSIVGGFDTREAVSRYRALYQGVSRSRDEKSEALEITMRLLPLVHFHLASLLPAL